MKIDVIIATETWLNPNIASSELCLNDYDVYRNDRLTRGGGVFVATRKELCGKLIDTCENTESVFVKINIKGRKSVVFGSVYRPPPSTFEFCFKTVDKIYKVYEKHRSAIFCLGGDFNLPDIDWTTEEIVGHQYPIEINQLFLIEN